VTFCQAIADIIRTTLGPKSMLKMLLDPMGGIVITNDGNAILREIDVAHPAAKSMLELARSQDEEVGDGTTSVIILAGEMLVVAEPFLVRNMHPTVIVKAFHRALDFALQTAEKLAINVDTNDRDTFRQLIRSCIGTKFTSRYGDVICNLAMDAVSRVLVQEEGGRKEIDIKRYAKVEKIPGGELEDSYVLDGVMIEKDVTHPKMKRRIANPRIVLLDCTLEYKKAESATNLEIGKEEDFEAVLRQEEEFIAKVCNDIIAFKPDLVITEKGISDLASHYFVKAGITSIRRVKKTDCNRIARACGATIVNRSDELQESDVGTGCGLFDIRKFGDEYFMFLEKCKDPKACTIILRGGSKDILNEFERNLQDAMQVTRNIYFEPKLLPGGGATEMSIAVALQEASNSIEGVEAWPFRAVASALEVIPRTLAQNCGADTVRLLTELRAQKKGGANAVVGIDGNAGKLANMQEIGVLDPYAVRTQVIKSAVEAACMLLRIDDILSGMTNKKYGKEEARKPAEEEDITAQAE
jgi:T-complex protein 1 subunit gamma